MPIQPTEKIWRNGQLIPWEQANIHVMSHVVHYGSSVFEGIRCYGQPQGSAVFRLPEHMQRLLDSAKIYRMDLPFTLEELCAGVVELIEANRNYVSIRIGRDNYVARSTLQQAEIALSSQPMLRISRSCLVNMNFVREMNRTLRGDFILVMAGGATVTSSEGFRARVRDYLGNLRIAPS